MNRYYYVCSSPDCDFSKSSRMGEFDDTEKFCPKCGGPLLMNCPECGDYLRNKDSLFCSLCGKPLKHPAD